MSAYVVEDETINLIVAALKHSVREESHNWNSPVPHLWDNKYLEDFCASKPQEMGIVLYQMNVNAVMQRYPNDPAYDDDYRYHSAIIPSMHQAYKSLQCYLYQCSEGDVDTLPLYKALTEYKRSLAEYIVERSDAYAKASWA